MGQFIYPSLLFILISTMGALFWWMGGKKKEKPIWVLEYTPRSSIHDIGYFKCRADDAVDVWTKWIVEIPNERVDCSAIDRWNFEYWETKIKKVDK